MKYIHVHVRLYVLYTTVVSYLFNEFFQCSLIGLQKNNERTSWINTEEQNKIYNTKSSFFFFAFSFLSYLQFINFTIS